LNDIINNCSKEFKTSQPLTRTGRQECKEKPKNSIWSPIKPLIFAFPGVPCGPCGSKSSGLDRVRANREQHGGPGISGI
jgi:hypothetical protein